MANKWTEEKFKKLMGERFGGTYKVLSKFIGYRSKVLLEHTNCGNIFEVTPASFLYSPISGHMKCPKCRNNKVNDD